MGDKLFAGLVICVFFSLPVMAQEDDAGDFTALSSNLELNGFLEARGGYRVLSDRYEKDMSIMETRLQLDMFTYTDHAEFKFKGDAFGCLVTEGGHFDMREGYV